MGDKLEEYFLKLRYFVSRPGEKNEPSAGFFPPRIREKAKILCLGKKGNILEVGCGEGLFLKQLALSCPHLKITGIDSWEAMVELAKKRTKGLNVVEVIHSEAKSLPFDNGHFSTAVALNLLYNLNSTEEVEKILEEMKRVCKFGGSIIFDIRNSRSPLNYYGYKLRKYYNPSARWPLRTYKFEEIEQILNKLKFRIVKNIPIGLPFCYFAPVLLIEAIKER
jgi:ubiquinone/menaquinone biosynthesis C-methylase UbiE